MSQKSLQSGRIKEINTVIQEKSNKNQNQHSRTITAGVLLQ